MTHKIEGGLPPPTRPADSVAAASAFAGGDRSRPVSAAPPADSLRLTGEAAGLQAIERELGGQPAAIDGAKVDRIRAALAEGSYRVDPQEVALRMLALERELAG